MSAILSADDLNDFISPGVACIKPINEEKKLTERTSIGEVEIQIDENGKPLEISKIDGKQANLSPAQISLSDCLACSGCITSAEEVLVAQHSHNELVKVLQEKESGTCDKIFVASISHQSRSSLATAYNLSVEEIDRLLLNLLINQFGFSYVVGTAVGRKLSLLYEAQGIIEKKEANYEGPTLSSICPGWVLYAEKTHPHVLNRVSNIKSPQQITGCLLKSLAAQEQGVKRSEIYHLSIMPCFDKKLESARPEQEDPETADVDCVLTAKELVTLLEQHQDRYLLFPSNFQSILNSSESISNLYRKASVPNWPFSELSWTNDSGSASGGYGFNYLIMTKIHLTLKYPDIYQEANFSLNTVAGRNTDVYEIRLMHDGKTVASSAVVNGFRNIQNLVRKLKPSNSTVVKSNPLASRRRARMGASLSSQELADPSKCDYVEIMACPNGCINGGGQISPASGVNNKDWINKALENYATIPITDLSLSGNLSISSIMSWCQNFCRDFDISESRLLKTWFHELEPSNDPNAVLLGAKW
ncbi:uncharacterized protein PRCAT00004794001 [Priceomyces carsonii]|uniref:uncharacterized protein n=1 Tax=Priceomyces carsonii TaxID=28549 RepID=UPI002ED8394C|nr:unnamed protein product [Priceomyces carsonii]